MQIDFYIIKESQPFNFCCRLLEKAYLKQQKVLVLLANSQTLQELDRLLWIFRDVSFVPHAISSETLSIKPPIILSITALSDQNYDILLNLSDQIPVSYAQYPRIIEVVANDEQQKQVTRQHFRFYKDQGLTINTHEINS